jgi:diguanylate cyclase (GGDEF)-like protein
MSRLGLLAPAYFAVVTFGIWLADGSLLAAAAIALVATAAVALPLLPMRAELRRTRAAVTRLGDSARALAEAQRLSHLGSWEWDVLEDRITWSDELYRIFDVERTVQGASFEDYVARLHPDDRAAIQAQIEAAIETAAPFRFEHRLVQRDGGVRTIDSRGRALVGSDGRVAKLLGTAQDITERRQAELELEHQALHDPLTQLPNRALFLDRLEHALTRSRRPASSLAVYVCNVDDFKNVIDILGHDVGDDLLVALPPRLREALRAGDTVARFDGDEFAILCEDLASEAEAIQIAERIPQAFELPFELDGQSHHLSVSVGVVFVRAGAASAADVLRDADAAMHRAKSGGKDRWELFDAQVRASLVTRLQTEAELRHALESDELRVYFQPLLSLQSDAFVGAEALVRWQHPERGLLGPGEFVPLAEESGLIAPLGAWVLGEAVRQAAAWGGSRRVSINLSPRQLTDSDVPALLQRALAESGIDPALIELEITETVLLEQSEDAVAALRRIKRMGVRLVLDDFGTGWSSLSYLKRFPLDGVKIDREFVSGLGVEPEDTAIVSAVLSMARALGLSVIAEGVETEEQLEWLRKLDCPYAQGFLLGRPMPSEELDADVRWRALTV